MKLIPSYKSVLLLLILLLGFLLRFYNFTVFPGRGATFDEYAWTWLGMNIIQKGVPISWSPHPQYTIREHYVEPSGAAFWLVQPYLEHPPLFGLFAGSWAILSGARDMYNIDLLHIRPFSLLLGVFSILMIYLFARELYGYKVGILSALLYATIPTVVIGSRILQNENFFIPFYILAVWLTIRYLKEKKSILPFLSQANSYILPAILCGLLTLAKVPWWGAALSCVFLLCSYKKYKQAVLFLGIVSIFFSLFFIWGFYWDKEVFLNLWKLQIGRYDITFDGIFSLFTHPYLVNELYFDGWIYAGWIALFALVGQFKEHKFLLLGFLGYFAIYILGIPNEPAHGWYRYPFYPFLVISLSVVIIKSIKDRSLFTFVIFLFAGLALLQHVWEPIFGFSFRVYRAFLIICGITSVATVLQEKKLTTLSNVTSIGVLFCLIVLNICAVVLFKK